MMERPAPLPMSGIINPKAEGAPRRKEPAGVQSLAVFVDASRDGRAQGLHLDRDPAPGRLIGRGEDLPRRGVGAAIHCPDGRAPPARRLLRGRPTGYALQRLLQRLQVPCHVVAPSLIPKAPGDRVKTDRRDCRRLARLHRAGELVTIRVPSPEEEAVRDLCRARGDVVIDLDRARRRLGALLPRRPRWGRPPDLSPTTRRRSPARCVRVERARFTTLEVSTPKDRPTDRAEDPKKRPQRSILDPELLGGDVSGLYGSLYGSSFQ
jgi:hypothetical protein